RLLGARVSDRRPARHADRSGARARANRRRPRSAAAERRPGHGRQPRPDRERDRLARADPNRAHARGSAELLADHPHARRSAAGMTAGRQHSETARQLVHMSMGGFALLLRWLTWWQALALATSAVLF